MTRGIQTRFIILTLCGPLRSWRLCVNLSGSFNAEAQRTQRVAEEIAAVRPFLLRVSRSFRVVRVKPRRRRF